MLDPEFVTRSALYAFASPLFVALIELAKNAGLPARFAPVLALVLGLATAFGAVSAIPLPAQHWVVTTLIGLALGLTASGLYSGWQATVKGR